MKTHYSVLLPRHSRYVIAWPILTFALFLFALNSTAQLKSDCCGKLKRNNNGNLPSVVITFNEFGEPDKPVRFVPYGSQINLRGKNVNPLHKLPAATFEIKNFTAAAPEDVLPSPPSIPGKNGATPNIPRPVENETVAIVSNSNTLRSLSNEISNEIAKINKNNAQTEGTAIVEKIDLQLMQLEATSSDITINDKVTHIKNTNEELVDKLRKIQEKLKSMQGQAEITEEQLRSLKEKNLALKEETKKLTGELENARNIIAKLTNEKQWGEELEISFRKFTEISNDLSFYLSLEKSGNSLFNMLFLNEPVTKKNLLELVRTRLPEVDDSLTNAIGLGAKFIQTTYNDLFKNYSIIVDRYHKLNPLPTADSFGTSKPISVELANKEKRKATLIFPRMDAKIEIQPRYKDQYEYVMKKMTFFKSDSLRNVVSNYSDTMMAHFYSWMNTPFVAPIKQFQATADEIKVTLPNNYKSTEPYIIKTYCRFKIEGSTALFAQFLGSDDKYRLFTDNDGKNKVIRQRKEGVTYGLGILGHLYKYDQRKDINFGWSIGINIPVNNQTNFSPLQLASGLTIHSTTLEKFSVTIGASLRKAQKLNTQNLTLPIEGIYGFKNDKSSEIIFDPIPKVGAFLGISYAIFGGNKTSKSE